MVQILFPLLDHPDNPDNGYDDNDDKAKFTMPLNLPEKATEKITNFSPPRTPQSARFPLIPGLRLRPDLVDCDAIFWIAEPIVGL